MQATRRAILSELADGPVTGPALADRLDVSRAAVWKHVEALREDGFTIRGTETGYELASIPEYGDAAVEFGLDAPFDVEYHEQVDSTNAIARERAADGATDLVVLADEQTGGRGRRARAWDSPSGGVWMSIVVTPDIPPARVPLLTLAGAVAVTEAVRDRGVDAAIKWPNDVVVPGDGERGGRKLCGILTEMAGESGQVSWVAVGIGLNANIDQASVPPDATSIAAEVGPVDRRSLVQDILERFSVLSERPSETLDAWVASTDTLGQHVRIETATASFEGEAIDVTETGALVVRTDGEKRVVHAGDCEHLRPA
ncbi:Biotin-(acetyl-CoA carboxylase) ligase [Halanaeroarchaeum sp. HSR-CO]|uniref:biotin--[acetyl-CoA-carboxylase] ligase n=1 Tax=Halanaeroarchaeum sp. HSR-CO TaxID=2866382 RepID=UPI00217E4FAE|nr:biotin--[acetyl-CoA-carboxylase] ligase [Halanaeroarchaeum sp. HSR-CO]UWG48530.1 Biotin-(acetyl-CoA carboxylase) ligase [Halanaeroarchaeum sp. HSR-CO]